MFGSTLLHVCKMPCDIITISIFHPLLRPLRYWVKHMLDNGISKLLVTYPQLISQMLCVEAFFCTWSAAHFCPFRFSALNRIQMWLLIINQTQLFLIFINGIPMCVCVYLFFFFLSFFVCYWCFGNLSVKKMLWALPFYI